MAGSPPPNDPGADLVLRLAAILAETGLSEIEVEREGLRVRVARTLVVQAAIAPPAAPSSTTPPAASLAGGPGAAAGLAAGEVVKSPMVGTVYLQAQPGSPPFARRGDTVSAGQTLLLIEAMKTMNPIVAPRAGEIVEVLVADAQPVEYGEPLIVLG